MPLALLLLLLVAPPATAREIIHAVAPDETLSDIAQIYYGDRRRADVIRLYNRLDSPLIQVGAELRIPVADEHTVRAGESWSELALRYWGDSSLSPELAKQCAGSVRAKLQVGQELRIPVLVPYRLKPGETLAAVSRRFYGHSERAKALARLNNVADPRRLQVGFEVHVPLTGLVPPPEIPPSPAPEPETPEVAAPPPPPGPSRFEGPLRDSVNAYLDGRYDQALERLEELRPKVLAGGTQAEQLLLLRYLVFAYTAYDRTDQACESYRALRQIGPDLSWDPDEVSPKILSLIASCDGS